MTLREFIDRSTLELAKATARKDDEGYERVKRVRKHVLAGGMGLEAAHQALEAVTATGQGRRA